MTGGADLHIHTVYSDGLHRPAEIVEMARKESLQVISISDHASVDGVAEAIEAAEGSPLQVISGVEISTEFEGLEAHILGYFVDYTSQDLQTALRRLQQSRLERIGRMLTRLAALGMVLPLDGVQRQARGGALGRPHIAKAMVEAGLVGSTQEAFRRYLGKGKPAYVQRRKASPQDAFRLIRAAGGLPVLAHPWGLTPYLPRLVAKGLVGLEAYYTGYSLGVTSHLVKLAQRHGLVCTGGSDFHGLALLPNNRLGQVHAPLQCVEALRERHRLLSETGQC